MAEPSTIDALRQLAAALAETMVIAETANQFKIVAVLGDALETTRNAIFVAALRDKP